jgi:aspartokinase/homoserine dehydrogenase 1
LSVLENVSLVNLEGRGLLGKTGVDADFQGNGRQWYCEHHITGIFRRGIGLVVAADKANRAMIELEKI